MPLATISDRRRPPLGRKRLWRALVPLAAAATLLASAGNASAQACGTPPCGGGGGPPITITLTQNLEFGTLAGDASASGTAVINATTGAKSVTGGVFDFGGVSNAASFEVKGKPNTPYTIILPGSVTLSSGGNSMSLGSFTSNPSGSGLLGSNGKTTLQVGATLQIGVSQPAGTYTGIFNVIVNY